MKFRAPTWRPFREGFSVGVAGVSFLIALVTHVYDLGMGRETPESALRTESTEQIEGREVELFEVAGEALERDPEDAEAHYVQGIVRLKMGQPVLALRHLDRVVRIAPSHDRAWRARSRAQEQIGDTSGARASLARASAEP